MDFFPPVAEQIFALEHAAGLAQIAGQERFAEASPEIIEAILRGIGELAAREYAPTNRVGDTARPRWIDGRVEMPAVFHTAYRSFVEGGWGGIAASPEHGGMGLPFSLAVAALESLGTANMGFGLIHLLSFGAIHAIEAYASDNQKKVWLPNLVSGRWNGTMNLTESLAGSDIGALKTRAEPAGYEGQWRIRGQKIFITFGECDLVENVVHLVLARTSDAPSGTRGISLFIVPKLRLDGQGRPTIPNGVRCVSIEHKLGIHSSPTCVMAYGEDEEECLGELVGELGGGMRAMFVMMNNARLLVGNQGVQIADRATQQALTYAQQRIQSVRASDPASGPVAIIEHPDVRRMLLRMKSLTQAARALTYACAGAIDMASMGDRKAAQRAEVLTPLAKSWASDVGCEVASLGIQVHGGMGFIEETGAAQHFRDARIAPIYEGTNGIQAADLVGRKLAMADGAAIRDLIDDILAECGDEPALDALAQACGEVFAWLNERPVDDRLAGSHDFLTMLAVAAAGWLMRRQAKAVEANLGGPTSQEWLSAKAATTRFFLDRIVPEALGRRSAAMAGAVGLYTLTTRALASA
ncbi:acyl-CoA dehydrogenase [Novosphingobium sp. CCH12-A3]|uniref:acyl-CoA dehydrogenase n=1 Tax=Novosphingobium sp. CCH12-A3 TaxID=1768752 RepID=UPI00078161CC|nr:acyl-CoA dehydrogenase [Novosphingobium sp. CCH12-A3]